MMRQNTVFNNAESYTHGFCDRIVSIADLVERRK